MTMRHHHRPGLLLLIVLLALILEVSLARKPAFVTSRLSVLDLRGGAATTDEIEQLLPSSDDNSSGLQKVRNVIRSILGMSESNSMIHDGLKAVFGSLERILGVKLLPEKKKKKKRRNKKTKQEKVKKESKIKAKREKKVEPTVDKPKAKKAASNTASKHVQMDIKSSSPNYRIQRELKEFLKDPPPNLSVKVGKNIRIWIVTMKGAKNTIYEGETFRLRVSFPAQYPTVPPSVYFLPPHIPVHEHVYTNGDICLSLLGKDWRPTMTAQSIAVSILSILSSAQSKSLPMDNARHAQNKPGEYQKDWVYHDDNC